MIERIKLQNIFSFIDADIELRPLNLLIGGNGVGKSNLVRVFRLLRALPTGLREEIVAQGGIGEIITKLEHATSSQPRIEVVALSPTGERFVHSMELAAMFEDYRFTEERFQEGTDPSSTDFVVHAEVVDGEARLRVVGPSSDAIKTGTLHERDGSYFQTIPRDRYDSGESIVKQFDSPLSPFYVVSAQYRGIGIYERWDTSLNGQLRKQQSTNLRSDRLYEDGSNLVMVLNSFLHANKWGELEAWMHRFNPRITRIDREVVGSHARLFFTEEHLVRPVAAADASDGTLHFLALLCVLLNPNPQGIICLEEPEIGMHPDSLPLLADLLREASRRSQIVVTTHSSRLIDFFGDEPEVVMVTERDPLYGDTVIERLDREELKVWLERYTLGKLWTKGQIGGNVY
jgi:predicted ATPase